MSNLAMFVIFHVNVITCQNFNIPHIYHIFVEKNHFLKWNFQINHMVSKTWFKQYQMTWVNIPSTFIKIKSFKLFLEYICVFEYTDILHSFSQMYFNLPLYKMKWNNIFSNILLRLYSNIICEKIVKIFQKFEMGYIQTCTSWENSIMWQPKGGPHSVLSPP